MHPTAIPLATAVAFTLVASRSVARTWHVAPDSTGDAPTVQAAIDAAVPGDEILLAPGRYTWSNQGGQGDPEILAFMIGLKPGITLRGDSGSENTILDGEGQGRVIDCSGPGQMSIEGLTVTGGGGVPGGGIGATLDSQPFIANCIVRNNDSGGGGGISCWEATIMDCQILDNRGGHPSGTGGGIACGRAVISRCTIRGNNASTILYESGSGGGIASNGATITDCWIEENSALVRGGGITASGGSITNCVFVGNRAPGATGLGSGGALFASDGVTIAGCLFVRNAAPVGAGVGTALFGGSGQITNCTFAGNSSAGSVIDLASGTISACIIAGNVGLATGGSATFTCNAVFGNSLGNAIAGTDAGDNFSADPQFCAVDPATSLSFTLQSDSPCAPGNHPEGAACGLIGAAPVGCGTVSAETTTWSRLKSWYR